MKINYPSLFIWGIAVVSLFSFYTLIASASDMDSKIEASAQKSYVYRTYLKDDAITIKAMDGAVTLQGSVAEASHKSLAQDTVANLPGVKSVDNQLVLKSGQPAENSDGWIGMKVKTAFLFHRNVNAFKTGVDVKDGVVTLKGEAASQAQKDLAGEYAKDVDGVKDVKNEMTIGKVADNSGQSMGDMIDDASIIAQVKMALLSHHSTSAVHTKIAVTDGVVTISGIAKDGSEKVLVTKLVNDVNGVKSVINNMTIADPVISKM